jgi:hypothetical protein
LEGERRVAEGPLGPRVVVRLTVPGERHRMVTRVTFGDGFDFMGRGALTE